LQEAFVPKTNSVLTENNGLDAAVYSMDVYLPRDTCGPSNVLHRPIWRKGAYFQIESYKL
jgi:hypothetical protein